MQYSSNNITRARPLLGTLVEIQVGGVHTRAAHDAIDKAFAQFQLVHNLMSFHQPQSDLSRINAAKLGEEVAVHAWTAQVLQFCLELNRTSFGAFDPGIAPLLMNSGLLPNSLGAKPKMACGSISEGSSIRNLSISRVAHCVNESVIVKKSAACILDLGGCAKGFAVDCAIAALQEAGIPFGLANAGGDLRCFGDHTFPVVFRAAREQGMFDGRINLKNQALATSALTFTAPLSPILDPRTQIALHFDHSVSVLAPSALVADALTKVVIVDSLEALPLLSKYQALWLQHEMLSYQQSDSAQNNDAVEASSLHET